MSASMCGRTKRAMTPMSSRNPSRRRYRFAVLLAGVVGLALAASPTARGDTNVFSDITQDTTWNLAGSPYIVTESVNVRARLIIEPGVVVKFTSGSGFNGADGEESPAGSIRAVGTASIPITFTSNSSNPSAGDWGRIA